MYDEPDNGIVSRVSDGKSLLDAYRKKYLTPELEKIMTNGTIICTPTLIGNPTTDQLQTTLAVLRWYEKNLADKPVLFGMAAGCVADALEIRILKTKKT